MIVVWGKPKHQVHITYCWVVLFVRYFIYVDCIVWGFTPCTTKMKWCVSNPVFYSFSLQTVEHTVCRHNSSKSYRAQESNSCQSHEDAHTHTCWMLNKKQLNRPGVIQVLYFSLCGNLQSKEGLLKIDPFCWAFRLSFKFCNSPKCWGDSVFHIQILSLSLYSLFFG